MINKKQDFNTIIKNKKQIFNTIIKAKKDKSQKIERDLNITSFKQNG